MSNSFNNFKNGDKYESDLQYISIFDLLRFFRLNKKIILISTVLLGSLNLGLAFTKEKIWEGQFQIVLDSSSKKSGININELLSSPFGQLTGGSQVDDKLTQIEILKSPSVLMPIFLKVKSLKGDEYEKTSFLQWYKNSLNIDRTKSTRVLNIVFKDNDKKIINLVLNDISKTYQKFSDLRNKKQIEFEIKEIRDQINIYKEKSDKSFEKLYRFAFSNSLPIDDSGLLKNTENIEIKRVKAANELKNLNELTTKYESLVGNPKELSNFSKKILKQASNDDKSENPLLTKIENVNLKIERLSEIYYPSDLVIQNLLKEKNNLNNLINTEALTFLKLKKMNSEINLKNASPTKEIMLEYYRLSRDSKRDLQTARILEKELRQKEIDKSQSIKPWELITSPTILDKPISPKKPLALALGLIGGFILGNTIAIYKGIKKDIAYSKEKINEILEYSFIEDFYINSKKEFEIKKEFLQSFLKANYNDKKVSLLILNNDSQKSTFIKKQFNDIIYSDKVQFKEKISSFNQSEQVLILIKSGGCTYKMVKDAKNKLELIGSNVIGWIFINEI